MSIEHVGVYVSDLERALEFYTELLGGAAGEIYENRVTGLRSCFVSFDSGTRLELMTRPGLGPRPAGVCFGYAHIGFRLGSPEAVDALVALLALTGVTVVSPPRLTGDGYYEAVVLDPEGDQIELMA